MPSKNQLIKNRKEQPKNDGNFKPFTGKEFEDKVRSILKKVDDPALVKIDENGNTVPPPLIQMKSKELNEGSKNDIVTKEKVYKIPTLSPAKTIIIYSSVEEFPDKSRDCGKDRVRLVLRLSLQGKSHYWHLDQHNRIETLFDNLEESILDGLARANRYWVIGGKDYIPDLTRLNTRMDKKEN
jgi:hypothetical protein